MVDQGHVDAALRKLGKIGMKDEDYVSQGLKFEQRSWDQWDQVLKKMAESRHS